jgi:hypothetical protein
MKAQLAKEQKPPKSISKKMTIRDLIKDSKGKATTIYLAGNKELRGTIVSVHADFFVMSVGENKEEHIVPFVAMTHMRPAAEGGWSVS